MMASDRSTAEELSTAHSIRKRCSGLLPLSGRLAPWIEDLCANGELHWLIHQFGSPLNLVRTDSIKGHIGQLNQVARDRELDFQVFFARKANKCLAFVSAAAATGAGIDVASTAELRQVLDLQIDPSRIVCTAAIKDERLIKLCLDAGVTIVTDNSDEQNLIVRLSEELDRPASIALRISGFTHEGSKLDSRFGFDIDHCFDVIPPSSQVSIDGIHFHLDSYSAGQRVSAITQSLAMIDRLRVQGHRPSFLDIGGGFPIRYVDSSKQWNDFCDQHRLALLNRRDPITFRNHGLGLVAIHGEVHGRLNCYPAYQYPTGADWFAEILDTVAGDQTISSSIRDRKLQLRCEPGRSLLEGCGMTVARVEFRKQHANGDWLIGLSMNGTQCRTTHDDFLVDPLLIPVEGSVAAEPIEGYLVGAYCMEGDLLLLRKLRFPQGIGIGDLVVFPNTAGYMMHFMESRSHQFPLAQNLVVGEGGVTVDLIDQ